MADNMRSMMSFIQQQLNRDTKQTEEFTLLPPQHVQQHIRLHPISANKDSHTVFALKYLTQKTIERFYAATQASTSQEVGRNVNETSMLSGDKEQEKKRVFEEIKAKYSAKLASLGGVNGVLKNLQDYIIEEITKLDENFAESQHIQSNRQFVEDEADKPIGRLKTALRALLDSETQFWPSVFHTGSNQTYVGIPFRELLAYYWLAASDKDMELEYETEDTKSEREDKLRYSKENFIVVLSEIRRAHNENDTISAVLDNPSCTMGTYGRITCSSIVYNPIGRQRSNPLKSDELGRHVMLFVRERFSTLSPEDKIQIGQYLSEFVYVGESSPEKRTRLVAFLQKLMSKVSIDELMHYMADNTHELRFLFAHDNPQKITAVREMMKDFLQVHAYSLLEPTKFEPNSTLLNGILEDSFGQGLEAGLKDLKTFRETIHRDLDDKSYALATRLVILKQKCLHEHAKCLLYSDYQLQSDYQAKITRFIAEMTQLKVDFDRHYQEILANYETTATQSIETFKAEGQLPYTSEEHQASVHRNISAMLARIIQSIVSPRTLARIQFVQQTDEQNTRLLTSPPKDFQNELPKPPSLESYRYDNKPTSWANYVIAIAAGTYRQGGREKPSRQTIEALRAAEQEMLGEIFDLFGFMQENDKNEIVRQIKILLENPSVLARLNKNDPENHHLRFIKERMGSETEIGLPKDNKSVAYALVKFKVESKQNEQKMVDDVASKPIFVESGFDIDEETALTDRDLRMMLAHKQAATEIARKNLSEWQKTALSFFQTVPSGRPAISKAAMKKLKGFVYLTVCRNLGIDYTHNNNIDTLEWLCDKYMIQGPTDMYAMLFPIQEMNSASIEKKIAMLSAHLSVLLTTIENSKQLFLSGHLCLMTRDKASDAIFKEKREQKADKDPFAFRISNSDPTKVSCNFSVTNGQRKLELESFDIPARTNPVTATIRVPNISQPFEVSRVYGRDFAAWLTRKRLERGGPALTTSVFGSVPIEEVLNLRTAANLSSAVAANVSAQQNGLSLQGLLSDDTNGARPSVIPRTQAAAAVAGLAASLSLGAVVGSDAERPEAPKAAEQPKIPRQIKPPKMQLWQPSAMLALPSAEAPKDAEQPKKPGRPRYIKRVIAKDNKDGGEAQEIKSQQEVFSAQKNRLLEATDTNSVVFESLKPRLLQYGYQEIAHDGNAQNRAAKIQGVETKQLEALRALTDVGFKISPTAEKNAFKVHFKTPNGVINSILCKVTTGGIFVTDPVENCDFHVPNFDTLLNQVNLQLLPDVPEKTVADLKPQTEREAQSNVLNETANKKLFIFDFDKTIVKGHWHHVLAKLGIEYGYPSEQIIGYLLNAMTVEPCGIKNPDELRKLFRDIISKGHHLSIRSDSMYPGVIRFVLEALGLTSDEIDKAYQDPDLSKSPKEVDASQSKGKNPEIIEEMLRFGINNPAQVTLVDDLEINLIKAREIGVFGIDSNSSNMIREINARLNSKQPALATAPIPVASRPPENKSLVDEKELFQFRHSIVEGYGKLLEFAIGVVTNELAGDRRQESKQRSDAPVDKSISDFSTIIQEIATNGNKAKTRDQLKTLAKFNTVIGLINPIKERATRPLRTLMEDQIASLYRLLGYTPTVPAAPTVVVVPKVQNPAPASERRGLGSNNPIDPAGMASISQAIERLASVVAANNGSSNPSQAQGSAAPAVVARTTPVVPAKQPAASSGASSGVRLTQEERIQRALARAQLRFETVLPQPAAAAVVRPAVSPAQPVNPQAAARPTAPVVVARPAQPAPTAPTVQPPRVQPTPQPPARPSQPAAQPTAAVVARPAVPAVVARPAVPAAQPATAQPSGQPPSVRDLARRFESLSPRSQTQAPQGRPNQRKP